MLRAGIFYAQPLRLWVSAVPTLPPWPQLGPALSFNWVSRLPLPPNIPPGALGNIPWFAADCPAPRSLRCGQSGRRPGGRGLGRQRPGTLHSSLAQEVVGGAEQQRKAESTHLITREHHLSAVLYGSLRLQSSLQLIPPWPLPLSKPLSCPRMCAAASRVSSQLLTRARLHPAPGPSQPCPPPRASIPLPSSSKAAFLHSVSLLIRRDAPLHQDT